MEEKKIDKHTLLITVVSVLTLLVAIVGATFAWFSATVSGNDTASSVIVKSASIGIIYQNGNEINMQNAIPGSKVEDKEFTVQSTGEVEQEYDINWEVAEFSFVNKSDLVYSLKGSTEGSGTVCSNITDATIPEEIGSMKICSAKVLPNETHKYKLSVKFIDTSTNQNVNQGKKFVGKIQVSANKLSASTQP